MKREEGFYWIRFRRGEWIVAQWTGAYWVMPGYSDNVRKADFECKEIDENRLEKIISQQ